MIELSFRNFYEQKYDDEGCCLYVMKDGLGDILSIGISTNHVWVRWFGGRGHLPWTGTMFYGNSIIGEKIASHFPKSWDWKIQLWTLEDCKEFCYKDLPNYDFGFAVRAVEARMIKILSPALNSHMNQNPGKDTTPISEKELRREREITKAYDEIFNKRK